MTALVDKFGRAIRYLRLSVTDRCDLRCVYCMPVGFNDYEEPEDWLTFDEIERVVGAFGALGVHRVRLTGGEPLVRRDLADLVARIARQPGIEDVALSTNASRLAKHAAELKAAGVSRINASLDTLRPETFKEITQGRLGRTLEGLMAAKAAGLDPIKLNMVVMKGVNDDEVEDMVEFCIEHGFSLRFIETMPVGATGRDAADRYIDLKHIRERLEMRFNLIPGTMAGGGPARYVRVANTDVYIGFITPMSQHFCDTCNRVRLSVDGTLLMCLGQDHSFALRPLLRAGISDEDLRTAIVEAINLKPLRHEFNEDPGKVVRTMSMTGG